MTFLIDHQLPPRLVPYLATWGWNAVHVSSLGFSAADDLAVWDFARAHGHVVITKDVDFVILATRPGDRGRLIWVQVGNCGNRELLSLFGTHRDYLEATLRSTQQVIRVGRR